MNGMYSIERYLDEEGKLLYINHLSREDQRHPTSPAHIIYEQLIKRASTIAKFPEIWWGFYDNVISRDDFANMLSQYIQKISADEILKKPEQTQPVKFIEPAIGDTTSLNQNDVFVYQKPTLDSRIIEKLYLRRDIVILDRKDEWYKVTFAEFPEKNITGYVHKAYLTPVEKPITNQ